MSPVQTPPKAQRIPSDSGILSDLKDRAVFSALKTENEKFLFVEQSDDHDRFLYSVSEIIYSGRTAFQKILIADTPNWGRILVLDGAIQSAEDDEALYHEALVQPAMLCHPDPKKVLIIGGGEGATLREVLVHNSVESATMVDIDREVVELCKKHLPSWHRGAFEDPRTRLLHEDGRAFIEKDSSKYDVVIIDIVDMLDNGPAQRLYTKQFYQQLRNRLNDRAIVVVQGLEFSFLDDQQHAALSRTLKTVFREVHSYRVDIPSFLSCWGFLIASDWLDPRTLGPERIDKTIRVRLGDDWLDHLTGDYLKNIFSLSKETRLLLTKPGPILEDETVFEMELDEEEDEDAWAPIQFPLVPKRSL